MQTLIHTVESLERRHLNTQQYIDDNVKVTLELLKTDGYICFNDDAEIKLTQKGQNASKFREIHCLVFSDLIEKETFEPLGAKQLVEIFGCFTNIKVKDDLKQMTPICQDKEVEQIICRIKSGYNDYMDKELKLRIHTGVDYEMHFDLLGFISKWCECECVEDCKFFLQELEKEKGILLGDFVKALLKINNICCEMENIAEQTGNVRFLSVLKEVPSMTMKYVVTNQSLYV
jgi:Mn-dependent DtxR family transcriptional regulator